VRNTGSRAGSSVIQVYAVEDTARPGPRLVGFRRVELDPGEERTVDVDLDLTPTMERDPRTRGWARRTGDWWILAAPHSPTSLVGARPLATADIRP
jgi:beta-glucosidase